MRRRSFLATCSSAVAACCSAVIGSSACSVIPTSDAAESATLTVSAAASLQDALEAIAPQFRAAHPEIEIRFNFASSGALQRQIEQGAPVDLFFSASPAQMDALAAQDLIAPDTRQDLVANRLVAIAPVDSTLDLDDLAQLKDTNAQRIMVGEFRSVPAGQYAEQVFAKLDLLDVLQPKFVFGSNVRGVLAAVESGNADLGVVYATDAALSDRVRVAVTIPEAYHAPIRYPIAVVADSPHPEAARKTVAFLQTEPARAAFADFGFTPLP